MNRREICEKQQLPGENFFHYWIKWEEKVFDDDKWSWKLFSPHLLLISMRKNLFFIAWKHTYLLKEEEGAEKVERRWQKFMFMFHRTHSSLQLFLLILEWHETWWIWSHLRWYRGCRLITWHLVTNSCTDRHHSLNGVKCEVISCRDIHHNLFSPKKGKEKEDKMGGQISFIIVNYETRLFQTIGSNFCVCSFFGCKMTSREKATWYIKNVLL